MQIQTNIKRLNLGLVPLWYGTNSGLRD